MRGGGASLGLQPKPDRLIRPLWIVELPAVLRGAALIDVVDRAIDTEDEPATVREVEFTWLESASSGRGGPWGLAPARDRSNPAYNMSGPPWLLVAETTHEGCQLGRSFFMTFVVAHAGETGTELWTSGPRLRLSATQSARGRQRC